MLLTLLNLWSAIPHNVIIACSSLTQKRLTSKHAQKSFVAEFFTFHYIIVLYNYIILIKAKVWRFGVLNSASLHFEKVGLELNSFFSFGSHVEVESWSSHNFTPRCEGVKQTFPPVAQCWSYSNKEAQNKVV